MSFWKRPDGKPNVYEWTACPVRQDGRLFLIGVDRDITERQRLDAERQHLAARLIEAQEAERQAIGGALHDHLGQLLTLARMELKAVKPLDDRSRQHGANAGDRLDKAIETVRSLARSLRPPLLDDLGLSVALEALVEDLAQVHDTAFRFLRRGPEPVLGPAAQLCLYRVLQEALTNAVRHSGASRITVSLATSGSQVTLRVQDNGKGLPEPASPAHGIGLPGIRERIAHAGGQFDIRSESGRGTRLTVRLPLSRPPPDPAPG